MSISPSGNDIYPNIPNNQYLTEFTQAYSLHEAACACRLMRNREVDSAVKQQRQAMLDMLAQILVNERNRALDQFCVSWLKWRNLPLPEIDSS